jgi:hypothetical protein
MSDPEKSGNNVNPGDAKISPEAAAAFGKARRSFGFSIGIMLLGFMAVGFALVYRLNRDSPPPPQTAAVLVPDGAEVVSALSSDGTIQVTYSVGGSVSLAIFDAGTGELVRTIEIGRR